MFFLDASDEGKVSFYANQSVQALGLHEEVMPVSEQAAIYALPCNPLTPRVQLIIITGLPCSGKTHRAQQIAAELKAHIATDPASASASSKGTTVQIINSHHASSDDNGPLDTDPPRDVERLRDQIYNSAAHEKTARAEEFSAIKRAVSKENIVIADGLNYIKGYRYQLWCEAKTVGTRCCVVHVAAQEEECKKWNRERLRAWGREAEDEDGDGDESIPVEGPRAEKQDRNVLGNLMPASHTAIYGDRVVEKASRSRSSSLDGLDGEEDNLSTARANDTMTLKSLYINKAEHDTLTGRNLASPSSNPPTAVAAASVASSATSSPPAPPTSSPPYATSTLNSLIMRYEPPSPFSRWDTPLFTIPSSDASPPTRDIWSALFPAPTKPASKKALSQKPAQTQSQAEIETENGAGIETETATATATVRPHTATVLPKATTSDALQILESATMDVVKHVLSRAHEQGLADSGGGGGTNTNGIEGGERTIHICIPISNPSTSATSSPAQPFETTLHVPPGLALSQPQLQRLRRKYTQMQRGALAHGQDHVRGRRAVVGGFVEFLDHEWNDDD